MKLSKESEPYEVHTQSGVWSILTKSIWVWGERAFATNSIESIPNMITK